MKKILLGVTAAFATVSLAAVPMTAHARDHGGNGGAIALGVIGGVAVGAAIASTANPYYGGYNPYYATPAPSYYYAPQSYYYPPANYYPPSSYYGSFHNDGY